MVNLFQRITGNKYFPLIFIPIAFLFVLIYSYTTSPLFINEGMDSCVFKSMGLAILQGKTPYADFFDHKGPILYFINAFGQFLIPGRIGIFILQIIGLSSIFYFLFKAAELFTDSSRSFIFTIISIILLIATYEEGNQCEEWELMAIAPSVYLSLKYLTQQLDKPFPIKYSAILGFCLGMVFFIRPNDAVSQIGGIFFGLVILFLYKKQYGDIKRLVLPGFVFFLIVAIPIIVWFASRNALGDLYYGLIAHNSLYAGGIANLFITSLAHNKQLYFLLLLAVCVLVYNSKFKISLVTLIPQSLFGLLLTGAHLIPHYFTVFLPLILLFWVFLTKQKNYSIIILSVALFYCCSYGSKANYIKGARNVTIARLKAIYNKDTEIRGFYEEADKLLSVVPQNERNEIWNYNLTWGNYPEFSILFHNSIVQCNRVPYFPMNMEGESLLKSEDIKVHRPKWIILTHEHDTDEVIYTDEVFFKFRQDYEYITSNYSFVAGMNKEICDIELFRRN